MLSPSGRQQSKINLIFVLCFTLGTAHAGRDIRLFTRRALLQSTPFLRLDGIGCEGGTYESKKALTPSFDEDSCEYICANNIRCVAYTWSSSSGTCFLKDTPCSVQKQKSDNLSGIRASVRAAPEGVSPIPDSVSESKPSTYADKFEFLPGTGCEGDTIERTPAETLLHCQSRCSSDSLCLAYTFSTSDGDIGTCYTKSTACESRVAKSHNRSGVKRLPARAPHTYVPGLPNLERGGSTFVSGFDSLPGQGCRGRSLDQLTTDTQGGCEAACASDTRCLAYSYSISSQKCYKKGKNCRPYENPDNASGNKRQAIGLGDSRSILLEPQAEQEATKNDIDATSSASSLAPSDMALLHDVALWFTQVQFEHKDRVGCSGPSLEVLDTADRWECQRRCQADGRCQSYTFSSTSGSCFKKATRCLDPELKDDNFSGIKRPISQSSSPSAQTSPASSTSATSSMPPASNSTGSTLTSAGNDAADGNRTLVASVPATGSTDEESEKGPFHHLPQQIIDSFSISQDTSIPKAAKSWEKHMDEIEDFISTPEATMSWEEQMEEIGDFISTPAATESWQDEQDTIIDPTTSQDVSGPYPSFDELADRFLDGNFSPSSAADDVSIPAATESRE